MGSPATTLTAPRGCQNYYLEALILPSAREGTFVSGFCALCPLFFIQSFTLSVGPMSDVTRAVALKDDAARLRTLRAPNYASIPVTAGARVRENVTSYCDGSLRPFLLLR